MLRTSGFDMFRLGRGKKDPFSHLGLKILQHPKGSWCRIWVWEYHQGGCRQGNQPSPTSSVLGASKQRPERRKKPLDTRIVWLMGQASGEGTICQMLWPGDESKPMKLPCDWGNKHSAIPTIAYHSGTMLTMLHPSSGRSRSQSHLWPRTASHTVSE